MEHTHTSSQEVRSGKFEMYDYGSAEDNMKHYGVVSVECVLGGWWRVQCVWEGGECRVCVGRGWRVQGCVCGRVVRVQGVLGG